MPPLVDNIDVLSDEIRALLDERAETPAALLMRLEHTLTDGYARALELEAERWRLERRIGKLASEAKNGSSAEELAELARRLQSADERLAGLRTLLDALNARAKEVRN